jgi:ribosome-associated protein
MNRSKLLSELSFKAIRSSGAGGQHVNKVSSKIELTFDLKESLGLSSFEKELLEKKLASKLTNEGVLILQCDALRSQHKNKKIAVERFLKIVTSGLKVPKKRKKTTPKKSAILKRLQNKKITAQKKEHRRKPEI